MKTKRLRMVVLFACVMWFTSQEAQAFYNPSTGRWLSRDPIEEKGGNNLYAFVKNRPTDLVDAFGQIPITSCYIYPALCNDKPYYPSFHCCCRGKLVSRSPVNTGVVTHKWSGPTGPSGTPVHWWLTWDGGSADANSYALIMQPGDQIAKSPAGWMGTPSKEIPLKLSACEYDFKKLKSCLTRLGGELNGKKFGMCWDLPDFMIEKCKQESKGCTVPK